ncbi:MAG: TonB-dependent receptor [Chitinophagaceae bacterium]|nr:MAG: TonB-dependent receptor [Chitinophagaceae bacterium]
MYSSLMKLILNITACNSTWKTVVCTMFICLSLSATGQNKTVTGSVSAESGEKLTGVSVQLKGTQTGSFTDQAGNFSMAVPTGSQTLVFSFIGFQSKEVVVTGASPMNVVLQPISKTMDDLVVIGYGSVKRSDLTGSVGTIKGVDLNRQKSASFLEAMQGKVAGVQITSQSGEPGAGVSISIRGNNSLNASSQPLYVIDGIQLDPSSRELAISSYQSDRSSYNPLASINPADIESIEVLKDASATAIYGSRGANGVIMIKTKGGRSGTTKVDYDGSAGISTMNRRIDVLDGKKYVDYMFWRNPADSAFGKGALVDQRYTEPRYRDDLKQYDWQDEVYRTGTFHSHNIGISGGNEKVVYSAGAGYYKQDGMVKNNTYERFSARGKVDVNTGKRFKYGVNLDYSFSNAVGLIGQTGPNSFTGVPSLAVVTRPILVARAGESLASFMPPDNLLLYTDKRVYFDRILGEIYGEYEIATGLRLQVTTGLSRTNSKGNEFYGKNTDWGFQFKGFAVASSAQSINYFERNLLTYDKEINPNHRLNFLAGFEINGANFETFRVQNNNFADESTGFHDISKGTQPQIPTSYFEESSLASYLGRVNYTMFDKYLFTASIRADGSSKFGTNNKFGYFPSAAFAWKLKEEKFLKDVNSISNLKLRMSYGATGNDRIPAYSGSPRMGSSSFPSNDLLVFGLAPISPSNPDLKWETTVQGNIGVDVEFLNGRVQLTGDIYSKKTRDMLLEVAIPSQSGYNRQWQNIGTLKNRGYELALSTINLRTKQFTWTTSLNLSANRNTILDLGSRSYLDVFIDGGWHYNAGRVAPGKPIGSMYGFVADGIYQMSDFNWQNNNDPAIPEYARDYSLRSGVVVFNGTFSRPGDIKFKDINGDGVVDTDNDRAFIGSSNPKYFGGITNTFTFKTASAGTIDLSFLLTYSIGGEIYNAGNYWLSGIQGAFNMSDRNWDNAWLNENKQSDRYANPNSSTLDFVSSYNVESASYMRLNNLTLGYALPSALQSRMKMQGFRFFITAQNLHVWSKYTGYDPEVASNNPLLQSYDRINGPRPFSLLFGINASF